MFVGNACHAVRDVYKRQVLYWDGKMRPYLPATDNPWKELFRTGWNQTYNLAISQGT